MPFPSERAAHARAFVDANYRFMAGYQEVNARINQRQQALALYPQRFAGAPVTLWLSALVAGASVLAILLSARWHFRPSCPQA